KVLERPTHCYRAEYVMLALLMERGKHIPDRAQVMLTALHECIQAAVLRIALPLVARESIDEQIRAEQSLGYICLSQRGHVIEANRRACHLVERYKGGAGIQELRGAVEDFAARARKEARVGQPWRLALDGSPLVLHVDVHHLAKERHSLAEDT